MKRNVTRIAVLGSGVMGSRIACHFAHTGFEVLLLDLPQQGSLLRLQQKALQLALLLQLEPKLFLELLLI